MKINWIVEIERLSIVKNIISNLDENKLWPKSFTRDAASESLLLKIEEKLNYLLPENYRDFLKVSDGWVAFYQYVDLFGSEEFLSDEMMNLAGDNLDECSINEISIPRSQLLPIAISKIDIDIFCIDMISGEIYWFAGGFIEKYKSFEDYFSAMIGYNISEVDDLKKEQIK